jgi:hypothetical protein
MDYSNYLDTDFECGYPPFTRFDALILTTVFFCLPNLDTLILTNGFCAFEIGLTAGATGQKGMFTPPRHLIPPPVYLGVRVSLFISLTCNSYLFFETDHSLVS